ncbi:hypothetical protein D3C79_1076520 [compost metagenome]
MVFKVHNSNQEYRALITGSIYHEGLKRRVYTGVTAYGNTVKLTFEEIEYIEELTEDFKLKENKL